MKESASDTPPLSARPDPSADQAAGKKPTTTDYHGDGAGRLVWLGETIRLTPDADLLGSGAISEADLSRMFAEICTTMVEKRGGLIRRYPPEPSLTILLTSTKWC